MGQMLESQIKLFPNSTCTQQNTIRSILIIAFWWEIYRLKYSPSFNIHKNDMVYLGYECEGSYSHKQLRNDISNSQLHCFSNKFPF